MPRDILLYENGSGGEMRIFQNDLATTNSLSQSVYLALFGGNVEANTRGDELQEELRDDYFGNIFLPKNEQFNSNTERVLSNTALDTKGLIKIEEAVKSDLSFLKDKYSFEIILSLPKIDALKIEIRVSLKNTKEQSFFSMLYNKLKSELVVEQSI